MSRTMPHCPVRWFRAAAIVALVLMCAGAVPALAQAPATQAAPAKAPATGKPNTSHDTFFAVDLGAVLSAPSSSMDISYTLYGENASVQADYRMKVTPSVSARVGMRVWRHMFVGLGITASTGSRDTEVTALLPHPFHFSQRRTVTGTADGLSRDEAGVFAEVGWKMTASPKVDVMVFAGPGYLKATQQVATKIVYTEQYPYDTATFSSVTAERQATSGIGVTGGFDLSYRLSKSLRAGALVRYSYAKGDVTVLDAQTFSIKMGGLQAGLGVRMWF
jgi:hypothetical protein